MDGTELKTGIELQPGAGETIELTLEDVRDPGYYTGSVRVALGDGQTISQTVELYAKESWWLLALWLGCGVLASSGLRYWFKTHRPSLIRRELLLRLSEQVDALPVDASMKGAREIQEALQRSIDDALTRLQAEWTEVDAEWKQNVDRWLKTLPACIALFEEWLLAQQPGAPPSSPAIEEARRVLRRAAIIASVLSLDDIDRAHKALIDAQRAESSQPVQERLDRQLEALAGMADAPGGVYDTARKRLTAARDALQDPARQAEAPRLLAEAEQAWTRVRVADLEAALAGKAIHTDRTSQWEQLRDDAAALDRALAEKNPPGDAAARLGTLLRAFLREVVTQIDEELKIQESTAEDAAPDKRSKIREAIAKVKDCRSAIAGQLERDDLERTDASYKELVAAYGALMALSSATMADRGAGLPAMTMALAEPKEPVQPPRGKARRRTVQSSEAVRRERQWKEAVVFVLGIGIALVAGTQALWLDNPTWGGPSSWIAAILWGLGLHQLTGLGLDGLEKPKEAGK
jgi:hypothetical protein